MQHLPKTNLRATFGPSKKKIFLIFCDFHEISTPTWGAWFRVWGAELGLWGRVWGKNATKTSKTAKTSKTQKIKKFAKSRQGNMFARSSESTIGRIECHSANKLHPKLAAKPTIWVPLFQVLEGGIRFLITFFRKNCKVEQSPAPKYFSHDLFLKKSNKSIFSNAIGDHLGVLGRGEKR